MATDIAFALFVALVVHGCAATFGFSRRRAAAGARAAAGSRWRQPSWRWRSSVALSGPVKAAAAGLLPALGLYLGGLHLSGLMPPQLVVAQRRMAARYDPGSSMALTYHDVRSLLRARYASPPSPPLQDVRDDWPSDAGAAPQRPACTD